MAYAFDSTGYDGGGRGNACAIDQNNSQNCAVAGDVWGTRNSVNGGDKWVAKMQGQSNMVYGRATGFSVKHPGRSYWGVGTLKSNLGGGNFCMQDPANVQLVNLSGTWGFGSSLTSASPGAFYPRAAGNRIVVDYDVTSGTEYVYGQAGTGIFRATDTTGSLGNYTGFSGTAPHEGGGLSMVLAPDGSLYAVDWGTRTSDTAATNQTLWHITNPRGTPTINTIAGPTGGGPMNRLKVINGSVWLLCANGLFKRVGTSWSSVATGFFGTSGHTFSDFCGVGQTMFVATGNHPAGTAHAAAKSTDGGLTWSWVTTTSSFDQTVQGTNRQFWLTAFSIQRGLTGDAYGTNSMDCGPTGNFVLLAGARGAFSSKDGGVTWHPSVNGLMGTETNHVAISSTSGEAWNDDTDWGTIHTANHYQTVTEISTSSTAHTYRAASLTSADGVVHLSYNGSFWDIQKNGVSVADTYSKGAIVNPTDVEHTNDDWIFISQFGGGVTVGNPSPVTSVVPPTTGSPTLSTQNPIVGQQIAAFPNASTWDGTPPLTFTYQWQKRLVTATRPFTTFIMTAGVLNTLDAADPTFCRSFLNTSNSYIRDEATIPSAYTNVHRYHKYGSYAQLYYDVHGSLPTGTSPNPYPALQTQSAPAAGSWVMLDIEQWATSTPDQNSTPCNEQTDPLTAIDNFKALAASLGVNMIAAASRDIASSGLANAANWVPQCSGNPLHYQNESGFSGETLDDAWIRIGFATHEANAAIEHFQAQADQGTPTLWTSFVNRAVAQATSVNPTQKITAGLSNGLTQGYITGAAAYSLATSVQGEIDGFWLNMATNDATATQNTLDFLHLVQAGQ